MVTVFNFEAGHNIPESKGGPTTHDNLRPICSGCNKAMGNRYTIDEFGELYPPQPLAVGGGNKVHPDPTSGAESQVRQRRRWMLCFGGGQ
jgi:hypothetical protein